MKKVPKIGDIWVSEGHRNRKDPEYLLILSDDEVIEPDGNIRRVFKFLELNTGKYDSAGLSHFVGPFSRTNFFQ